MTSATAPSSVELRGALRMQLTTRPVRLRGSAAARALLGLFGWRVLFDGLPARQGVAIVYPHTSNWDFVVGLLAKWSIGIPVTFWGKASLFRVPLFGRWLRWLGGRPVDRAAPQGIVGQMAEELKAAQRNDEFMWLALAPEGTRQSQDHWRSGFYHVALEAQVPLALACFDFANRVVKVEHFVALSGDADTDLAEIRAYFAGCRGKRPGQAAPIRFKP
jgi:1-acyl-sn-glycerol-3-phosphate acyltransferase